MSASRVAGRRRPPLRSDVAERLLAEVRAEAARADTKASVLMAVVGMVLGALAGVRPQFAYGSTADRWWIAGCCLTALGLTMLLAAVAPRRGPARRPGLVLSHFGDIRAAAAEARLPDALRWTEDHPDAGVLAAMEAMSRIVAAKYRWLRAAGACLAAAIPTLMIAITIG
jgi:hypothetical protein